MNDINNDDNDQLNDDQIRSLLLSHALRLACDKLCKIGQISAGDRDEVRILSESELYVDLVESAYPELFDSHHDRKIRKYSKFLADDLDLLQEALPLNRPDQFTWHNDF